MTRAERLKEKLLEEALFLKSIVGKYLTSDDKNRFRDTSVWKTFRKKFSNKPDALSLKKLPKRWNLHHMSLSPYNYTCLDESLFIPLGSKNHEIIHHLYGLYRKDKAILDRLKDILDTMCEINSGKDICDFRTEYMRNNKPVKRERKGK
jgi:hypothetical protein